MRAAVMEQFGEPLKVHDDWADPECGPRDAVIKVEACGICRSDYTLWNGGVEWMGIIPRLPGVLGHEYCGVVEGVGSEVTGFQKGDRVVSPFGHACGSCEFCDSGHQNVCANLQLPGMHYTGGYAGYTKVAHADVNLVTLPAAIPFAEAAGMGCRFVTSYHGVVDQAAVQPGEWVAVFACGGVGLAAVNIAAALGAQVIAVSRSDEKLALAKELGASHTVTAGDGAPEKIRELTGGGVHVSVDALGAAETAIPRDPKPAASRPSPPPRGVQQEGLRPDQHSGGRGPVSRADHHRLVRHAGGPLPGDVADGRVGEAEPGPHSGRHRGPGESQRRTGVPGRVRHGGYVRHHGFLAAA